MGFDLDIIDDYGNLIDSYSIKWLHLWKYDFLKYNRNYSIEEFIEYCNEEINELTNKINKLHIILDCWNETNFEKRKKMKINLLSNIEDEKEFYSIFEYFIEFKINDEDEIKLSKNSKLLCDFNNYSLYLTRFKDFKNFLVKYQSSKCYFSY